MKDANTKVNPFLAGLGSVFKAIFFVIGTFVLATILEFFGMHSWWTSSSESRLQQRTQIEIQKIENSIDVGFERHWFRRSYECISKLSDRLLQPVEVYLETQQKELEAAPDSMSAVVGAMMKIQQSINKHLAVAIKVFQAWLFRLLTFMFGIVSVIPLLLVGLVDGLVRREVRRWSGGRESAWLFVFASKSLLPLIALFLGIYVLWPWSRSFVWINGLMGVCWGGALSLALAKFKKYL